jgi:hypothetical protein
MTKHKQPPTTILVGSIPLANGEVIKVELAYFVGRHAINIRHWVANGASKLRPTEKGIFAWVEELPELDTLVRKARKRAERDGLLPKVKGEQADE